MKPTLKSQGILDLVLEGRWWDRLPPCASRANPNDPKMEEYRDYNLRYAKILLTKLGRDRFACGIALDESDFHPYHTLRARNGYTGDPAKIKMIPIIGFRIGPPHPPWADAQKTSFCIQLGIE